MSALGGVLLEVGAERERQTEKWGTQDWPDGTGYAWDTDAAARKRRNCDRAHAAGKVTFRHILEEEVAEAFAETDPARLRAELIQVAAGGELADIELQLSDLKAGLDETKKEAKERAEELEARRAMLAKVVRERSELRPVQVETIADFTRNMAQLVRLDTGEVWATRALAPAERQEVLQLDDVAS